MSLLGSPLGAVGTASVASFQQHDFQATVYCGGCAGGAEGLGSALVMWDKIMTASKISEETIF